LTLVFCFDTCLINTVKYRLVALVLIVALLAGAAAYHAPRFLVYADRLVKSDALVLFLGPEFSARKKEADQLLDRGYARYLIFPSLNMVYTRGRIPVNVPCSPEKAARGRLSEYPPYYEKTHLELLYAKRVMTAMGLRSAIMVSSPYHMKRISMIAERVFGYQSYFFSYAPTLYGSDPIHLREMNREDWMFVMSEYVKICWFQLYSCMLLKT